MASIGGGFLDLLGFKDPRARVLQGLGQDGGQPGHTPGGALPSPGAPTPAAPAQPQAYTSPPELLSLYNDLLGRQERESRINNGLGLIGSSFARPENRAGIMAAMSGGGTDSPSDTLNLIMQMQELQKGDEAKALAAQDKERQLGTLPAIAEQYGLSPEATRLLFDNGGLDEFVAEAGKPNVEIREAPDGGLVSVNKNDGSVKILSQGLGNTTDSKDYNTYKKDQETRGGEVVSFNDWQTGQANLKAPKNVINNNLGGTNAADQKLMEAFDTDNNAAFTAARDKVQTIETVQQARRAMDADGGVVVGDMTAPARVEARKVFGTLFGFDDKAAANTEVFNSQMKSIVLPLVKQLGTGNSISNADREYVEKMVGTGTLTEEALRRILDITERGQRRDIVKANDRMQARVDSSADDSPLRKTFQPIAVPELSAEYVQGTLENVDRTDLSQLVDARNDMNVRAAFDSAYGEGASRDVIEAATGMDPGPLRSKPAATSRPDNGRN